MYKVIEKHLEFKDINYFYHVSLNRVEREFIPRVPESRAKQENDSVKRICVATSLKHCLSAMPNAEHFKLKLEAQKELGIPFLVYVYKIKKTSILPENIIYPEELKEQYSVADSPVTEEHWVINQNVIFEEPIIVQIEDINQGELFIRDFASFIYVTIDYEYINLHNSPNKIFTFLFTNKKDLNCMKNSINKIGQIVEERVLSNNQFISLKFIVNNGSDISNLLECYANLLKEYSLKLEASDYNIINEIAN